MSDPLRIAALISGGGRTLINILDTIDAGELNATIELVIASRGEIAGVELAEGRGLEVRIVRRRDFDIDDDMHDSISAALIEKRIELVCLCGYLRWFRVDEPFIGRVMNIHPALLPDFGGQDIRFGNGPIPIQISGANAYDRRKRVFTQPQNPMDVLLSVGSSEFPSNTGNSGPRRLVNDRNWSISSIFSMARRRTSAQLPEALALSDNSSRISLRENPSSFALLTKRSRATVSPG